MLAQNEGDRRIGAIRGTADYANPDVHQFLLIVIVK